MSKQALLNQFLLESSKAAGEAYANAERVDDNDPRFGKPFPATKMAIGYWRKQRVSSTSQHITVHAGPVAPASLDMSSARVAQLISPELESLPGVQELSLLLFSPNNTCPLPVRRDILTKLQQDAVCHNIVGCFAADQHMPALETAVSFAFDATFKGLTEPWTADIVNNTIVSLLQALDNLLPVQQRLGITFERNKGDSVSGMTRVMDKLSPLRPDGVIRHRDMIRLLLKWEEKGQGDLSEAVNDLWSKTVAWPDVYYGIVPYLVTFAAAGQELQFVALEKSAVDSGARPTPIGPVLRTDQTAGRASLVLASVQLYKLLMAVARVMPEAVAPLNQLLTQKHNGITRTIFYKPSELAKAITPWSQYSKKNGIDLPSLQAVYEATRTSAHLVHGRPELQDDDTYYVELKPVGITPSCALPRVERDVACAVKCGLGGLAALHQLGFVHRDVRGPNFTSNPTKSYYFFLDLELSGREGVPGFMCRHWDEHKTLVDGQYTSKSDLYDFGAMVGGWAGAVRSAQGQAVLQLLNVPAREQSKSAMELLALPEVQLWFSEQGV